MMNLNALISLERVSKRFGALCAVDDLSLDIDAGSKVAIFGPNGAGKTTLMRIIAGVARPSAGRALIDSIDLADRVRGVSARAKIGYIAHQSCAYDELSARANLTFFAKLYRVEASRDRIERALDDVGLFSRADDPVSIFSQGMRQRLAIARAMIHDPLIALFDEPFSGLDEDGAASFAERAFKRKGDSGATALITHNIALGLDLADRAIGLFRGRMVFDLPTGSVDSRQINERLRAARASTSR